MRVSHARLVRAALVVLGSLALAGPSRATTRPAPATDFPRTLAESRSAFAFRLFRALGADSLADVLVAPQALYASLAELADRAQGTTALGLGELLALPAAQRRTDHASPWDFAPLRSERAARQHALALHTQGSPAADLAAYERVRQEFDRADAALEAARRAQDSALITVARARAESLAARVHAAASTTTRAPISCSRTRWVREDCVPAAGDGVTLRATAARLRGAVLALADSITFQGTWRDAFDERHSHTGEFVTLDGRVLAPRVMARRGRVRYGAFRADGTVFRTPEVVRRGDTEKPGRCYPKLGGFQVVELPLLDDALSLVLVLPIGTRDTRPIEAMLAPQVLERWLAALETREVALELPVLHRRFDGDIGPALDALGLAAARDPSAAALGDGVRCSSPPSSAWLGDVRHQCSVDLAERGPLTVVASDYLVDSDSFDAVGPWPFVPQLRAWHPFLFLIRDRASGDILFLGRFARP